MEKEVSAHANVGKNRLYIVANGFFRVDDLSGLSYMVKHEIEKLKPGFVVISDLRNFKPGGKEVQELIAEIMGYLANKVGGSIRVVDESVLGLMQVRRISRNTQYSAPVEVVCSTMEEAEHEAERMEQQIKQK